MSRATWVIVPAILCGLAPLTHAAPDHPLDLIPVESLLCWKGLPVPDAQQAPAGPSPLSTLLEMFVRIGGKPLDSKAQLTVRVFETIGAIARYPFAITLIDARAKPTRDDGSGSKVDQLRIAAVVRTNGKSDPFRRIIQKAINEQTDAGVARLEKKTAERWTYQELRDTRLPPWCVIAWGELGEHFVITVGDGVWPQIASVAVGKAEAVSKNEWVAKIRQRRREEPLIEVILAAQDMRKRLDPFVQGRASAFFNAWRRGKAERMLWELGFQGRALYCTATFRDGGGDELVPYADPNVRKAEFLQTIPEESRYAVYRLSVADFLPRLISSYYATRSAEEREAAARIWAKIQADLGVNAERDALAHLGQNIILHNYPQHPFHLPLAFTSLIEIDEEAAKVKKTLETLCHAWQEAIEQAADETGEPCIAQLHRDDDGVWFFQFGPVAGLAWTFTDEFIVTSWSPTALRDYLERIGDKAGKRE